MASKQTLGLSKVALIVLLLAVSWQMGANAESSKSTYLAGAQASSELSDDEPDTIYPIWQQINSIYSQSSALDASSDMPEYDHVDYSVELLRVTEVRNQTANHHQNFSWAYATVAAMEGQERFYGLTWNEEPIRLSEQYLIDCVVAKNALGIPDTHKVLRAYETVKERGAALSKYYPEQMNSPFYAKDDCAIGRPSIMMNVNFNVGYQSMTNSQLEKHLIRTGPVMVTMSKLNLDETRKEKHLSQCDNQSETHFVTIVGFFDDKDLGPVFKFKNSWGEKWGDRGYGYVARNDNCKAFYAVYKNKVPEGLIGE